MVWLKDLDTERGLDEGNWDHSGVGGYRRETCDGAFDVVQHGDIYELVTANPNT